MVQLDPQQTAVAREDLLLSSMFLFRHARGKRWVYNWHHRAMGEFLMRVFRGEIKRAIINIPPRYTKTELAVVNFMAFGMGHFPDSEFIHASYSKRLATKNTYQVRAIMQSEAYRDMFPGVQLADDSRAKDEFRTEEGGVVYAAGTEGTITGYGAGKVRPGFGGALIIDDPHKAAEAESDVMRANVIDWYQSTVESRLNSSETPIIVIMQRLHSEDLAGWLLDGGTGEEWEHLCIPALDENGKALWPWKHDEEALRRMEQKNPYHFAGQYMQEPAPRDAGQINAAAFVLADSIPGKVVASVRYWDKAGTAGAGAYTAGVLVHRLQDGRFVVADVVRGQWGALEREKTIKQTAQLDTGKVDVWIEQEPGSGGKESAENTIRNLAGFNIQAERVTGDKVTRAQPFAAQVGGGNVIVLKRAWTRDYIEECRLFPNGKRKDQVDATSGAFNKVAPSGALDVWNLFS